MMKWIFCLFLVFAGTARAEVTHDVKQKYVDQMYLAFQLQSMGQSLSAFAYFSDAYSTAMKNGESLQKLMSIQELFFWYRKFGYNCGVMSKSSGCIDEHASPNGYKKKPKYGTNFDPLQEKMIRDFLFGVGQVVSGVFCVTVGSVVGGRFGVPLIISGANYMYQSVSSMIKDSAEKQARLRELEQIEKKAESSVN